MAGGLLPEDILETLQPREVHVRPSVAELLETTDALARRLAGRSLGLVLSGGGARAFAHLGVVEVLRDAGLRFDRFAGVSLGSIVAGAMAMGFELEAIYERFDRHFVAENPSNDYTLPAVAVLRGRKTQRVLKEVMGETHIEELPKSFFCLSCDLVARKSVIHRTGLLREAIYASLAIPGVFPPVAPGDGRLLVDGGVLDNLPVETMSRAREGPVIASDVTMHDGRWAQSRRSGPAKLSGLLRPGVDRNKSGTAAPRRDPVSAPSPLGAPIPRRGARPRRSRRRSAGGGRRADGLEAAPADCARPAARRPARCWRNLRKRSRPGRHEDRPVLTITLRDLQFRRRQFGIAVVGAAVVFGLTLLLTGMSAGLNQEIKRPSAPWTRTPGLSPPGSRAHSAQTSHCRPRQRTRSLRFPGWIKAVPLVRVGHEAARPDGSRQEIGVIGLPVGGLGGNQNIPSGPGLAVVSDRLDVSEGDAIEIAGRRLRVERHSRGRLLLRRGPHRLPDPAGRPGDRLRGAAAGERDRHPRHPARAHACRTRGPHPQPDRDRSADPGQECDLHDRARSGC